LRCLAGLGLSPALVGQGRGDTEGAARDLVYQALETLGTNPSLERVTQALRFLRRALDQSPSFGDAHYYRYLCLNRLNQDPGLQKSSLESAQRYRSEAFQEQRNPFVLAVPKVIENLATVGQKWALVVGISRFQSATGATRLLSAANDATAFATLLRDPNVGRFEASQVFELINSAATTAAIKARLNTIARRAKPEDIVVVYISTHGSARSDDLRDVSYLFTYDTDVTSRDQIFGTALAMVEVSNIISSRCLAQRTVVILDTCHSGAASPKTMSTENLDRLRGGAGRYVLSSCDENQLAYEDAEHGYFTSSLIDRMRAAKGCLRMKDLYSQVRDEVSRKVLQKYRKEQRPVMAVSNNASEIILGAAPGTSSDSCTAKA
jgi:hypothetical protein